jgi:hypothetical protein
VASSIDPRTDSILSDKESLKGLTFPRDIGASCMCIEVVLPSTVLSHIIHTFVHQPSDTVGHNNRMSVGTLD